MEYEKSYVHRPEMCPVKGYQDVLIGIPVEIKPFAEVGRVKTECLGKPIIHKGTFECEGRPKETCKFTISQKLRVEVPVAFGAKTEIGQARVNCKCHEHGHGFMPDGECGSSKENGKEGHEYTCDSMIG